MISKYLVEIRTMLENIESIFNDDNYFKNLEKHLAKVQKENIKLREQKSKAINYIEEKGRLKYKPQELLKILKGD